MIKLEKKYLHVSFKKWWKDTKKKIEHVLFHTMRWILIIGLVFILWNSGAFGRLKAPSWHEVSYLCRVVKETFVNEY